MSLHRRRLLAATGATISAAVAGCSSLPDTDDTTEELTVDELHQTPTHVADCVELSLPDEIPTVDVPNNADLIVLPGDTDVDAEQAVDWLAEDRRLALRGDDAEATWLDWVRSDAYDSTFENEGYGASEPDPDLLLAGAVGQRVARYSRTWHDGPRNRDLVRALDEMLVDLAERTPR